MNWRSKGLWAVVLIVCLSVIVLIGDYLENQRMMKIPLGTAVTDEAASDPDSTDEQAAALQVYIVGEINRPGQYTLKEGDRVSDAVELAGGLTSLADPVNNNLARCLRDGEKIIILGGDSDVQKYPELAGKVNLNTATKNELMTLDGIGEVLATRIIDDRDQKGLFQDVEDILRVKGIGEAKLKKFKDSVCVY